MVTGYGSMRVESIKTKKKPLPGACKRAKTVCHNRAKTEGVRELYLESDNQSVNEPKTTKRQGGQCLGIILPARADWLRGVGEVAKIS
jgi:hypothetical protein